MLRGKKNTRNRNDFRCSYWRRVRDLNPGTAHHGYTISSRAPSTTQPTLHLYFVFAVSLSDEIYYIRFFVLRQAFFSIFFIIFFVTDSTFSTVWKRCRDMENPRAAHPAGMDGDYKNGFICSMLASSVRSSFSANALTSLSSPLY